MKTNAVRLAIATLAIVTCVSCGKSEEDTTAPVDQGRECISPENPYDGESGHDAGFKWAEETGGNCDGNSESFNEGCAEYQAQLERYQTCLNANH